MWCWPASARRQVRLPEDCRASVRDSQDKLAAERCETLRRGADIPASASGPPKPHPGVTSAIIGPPTMEQLDDLLAGIDVMLTGDILDHIDDIVPPGTTSARSTWPTSPRRSMVLPFAAAPPANAPPPDY